MTKRDLCNVFSAISNKMQEQCSYLVELDARNGDGDLGLSMSDCWRAVAEFVSSTDLEDLGYILMQCSKEANAAAPSTLGTIMSFWMMGAAKALRGKTEVSIREFADALMAGIDLISVNAGSKLGDKTVLDAIIPAVNALKEHAEEGAGAALNAAFLAAEAGMESTKDMISRHGRAAYYGEQGRGLVDGGAVAGKLIFEAAAQCFQA